MKVLHVLRSLFYYILIFQNIKKDQKHSYEYTFFRKLIYWTLNILNNILFDISETVNSFKSI